MGKKYCRLDGESSYSRGELDSKKFGSKNSISEFWAVNMWVAVAFVEDGRGSASDWMFVLWLWILSSLRDKCGELLKVREFWGEGWLRRFGHFRLFASKEMSM
jgi:hypothetical protein